MRVGSSSASPERSRRANGAGASQPRPLRSHDAAHQRDSRWNARRSRPGPAPRRPARRRARQQRVALGGADREAGEVVVAVGVHARHLRRLAADQRAAGLRQPSAMPATTARACVDVELAGGEVVEEEQRLGALHHDVVDAHRHQVDADRVVDARLDRDLELGADAVGAGDQHRIAEARRLQVEQARRSRPARPSRPAGRCARASGLIARPARRRRRCRRRRPCRSGAADCGRGRQASSQAHSC